MTTKRLHIIPLGDIEDHESRMGCWCCPLDNHDGTVTHNAKDCREQMERAGKPTGKIWCRIAESYDDMQGSLANEVRSWQEYTLALKLEAALRNHMTNYGGPQYAEAAIAAIRSEVGLEEKKPSYRCEKCHKSARMLDSGNWLHRINPGETPSVWMCDICIKLP